MCIVIGAKLAGKAGALAPPLFNPRPEIYSIKCAQVGFCGENSPKFSGNAPALFRALRRQCVCTYSTNILFGLKFIFKLVLQYDQHWRQSALNSTGAFPENFEEFSPQKPTYAHFIL